MRCEPGGHPMTTVRTSAPAARGSHYARLSRQVREAGLLERRPGYYAAKIVLTVAGFAACWIVFAFVGASWWTLLVAVALAVAYTQVAFVGHDAGHKQI